MKKLIIASTQQGAGKTSLIVGMMKASGKKFGYLKPLGDRLLYKKKRQWDYDSAVVAGLCGLQEDPENMTIGFEHSKLRYMYDEEGVREKLDETMNAVDGSKDVMMIEGGRTLTYGISVNMDAISLCRHAGAQLVVVVGGNDDGIIDDITFAKRYIDHAGVNFGGVIINKVRDKADFEDTYLPGIEEMNIKVLGLVPYREELTYFTAGFLADKLFAKVLSGEQNLSNELKHIVVGAMTADHVVQSRIFASEAKLVITSGDRSDMILAAIENKSAAVILTNNILPHSSIISRASDLGVPLLLVRGDTFATAKQIDDMEPLMVKEDTKRADLLANLAREYIKYDEII